MVNNIRFEGFQRESHRSWTKQKYISQGAFCAGNALEFTSLINQVGIINLGSFAREVAPGIVPLEIIKNMFYIPAFIFGIWHAISTIAENDKKIAELESNLQKWSLRRLEGQNRNDFQERGIPGKLRELGEKKTLLLQKKWASGLNKEEKRAYSRLENRFRRWTNYAEEALRGESTLFEADCQKKIIGYQLNLTTSQANSGKLKTREWLDIVVLVFKLAIGIIGLVATYAGYFASPLYIASFATGIAITTTLSIAKFIYVEFNPIKQLTTPHLDICDRV